MDMNSKLPFIDIRTAKAFWLLAILSKFVFDTTSLVKLSDFS